MNQAWLAFVIILIGIGAMMWYVWEASRTGRRR